MVLAVAPANHIVAVDNLEDWELIDRCARVFECAIARDDFDAACEHMFQKALAACQEGRWVLLQQAGDDLEKLTLCCRTSLLHHAIALGESLWVKELIVHRVHIHSIDAEGNSPLHIAAREGMCHLIEDLIRHYDLDIANHKQQTPLHVAIQAGQHQFAAVLVQKGANVNRLAFVDNAGLVKLNALGFAAMRGEKQCIDVLIDSKKCNLKTSYQGIGSLLHVCLHFHQYCSLEFLLSKYKEFFDVEAQNQEGLTPLSFAAALGEDDSISLLHYYGASIDAKDSEGRSPMHHAAIKRQHDTIQLLAALGSKITPVDHAQNRPLDLLMGCTDGEGRSCLALLTTLSRSQEACKQMPQGQSLPPSNLVLRGGGAKGLAFVGVLEALHERQLWQTVERLAGTSAGAITVALAAINFPIAKLQKLLMETDLVELLLDHPLSKKKLSEIPQGISAALSVASQILKTCLNPTRLITEPLKALYKCTGICEGEEFRKWMEDLIAKETGIPLLTFGELAKLIQQGRPYKHLHMYGTRVGSNPEIVQFSSTDSKWENVIISDAVRLSMSIPGVFKPHVIHIKSQGKRIPAPQHGSFLDGGMLYNFPVETFDQKQFFTREDLGTEAQCPKYNKRTIGFSLYSSLASQPANIDNVTSLKDLLWGIVSVYMSAEESIRQLNPYNASRVIEIDVKDIGTLSFNMPDAKKQELVSSGKQATKTFLDSRQVPKDPRLNLPLIGITGLSLKLTKGLNIEGICVTDTCRNSQQTVYVHKGIGIFNLAKEWAQASCPECTQKLKVKDFGFWDCIYSIEGSANGADVNRVRQVASRDVFLKAEHILDGVADARWSYATVVTESSI